MKFTTCCALHGLFLAICLNICASEFINITSEVFGNLTDIVPSSFGDLNADKLIDIFVIGQAGRTVDVLIPAEDKFTQDIKFRRDTLITSQTNDSQIVSAIPADFDGDLQIDLLVVRKGTEDRVLVQIYWGNGQSVFKSDGQTILMVDEPLIMDYDGDLIPDLLGETVPGQRYIWVTAHRNITKVPFVSRQASAPLKIPSSNGFLDLNGDYAADVVVTSANTSTQFEIWRNRNGSFVHKADVPLPSVGQFPIIGQLSFLDMESDGHTDFLLPVCTDNDCATSSIYVYSQEKWHKLPVKFTDEDTVWRLTPPDRNIDHAWHHPLQLWVGDYNQDSFPDALALLHSVDSESKVHHQVVLLENTACTPGVKGCPTIGRTFRIMWDTLLNQTHSPVLATFYDVGEDGSLDVLVVTKNSQGRFSLLAFKNSFAKDNCFIKAMVLSGLCSQFSTCSYGLVSPGASVCYNTTTLAGNSEMSCGAQLSRSSYFALQLPYVNFGLGQTPNFVDRMVVGIPQPVGKHKRHHQWSLIIPNSQLVVYPYPPDQPSKWKNRLFVMPGRLMLLTGIVLLGTCAFIAIIVGLLHWKERREDRVEKRQDAHKFHFDAM